MKHALIAVTASLAVVALAPAVQARSLRADIQCPYGNGGVSWTPVSGNPLSISTGVSGAYTSLFVPTTAGSISSDDVGLSVTTASQYNTYAATPDASTCGSNPNAPTPLAQVMNYRLGSGNAIGSAGDIEVEFNYGAGVTSGAASFSLAGVTFTASGLSFANDSDFLFSATGAFKGAISNDGGSLSTALPTGWSSKTGGGTVSAPEIDSTSTAGALALLFAGATLLRSRRTRPSSSGGRSFRRA